MRGAVVLCSGLPASGKKTVAKLTVSRLSRLEIPAMMLDGMTLRKELWPDLGFTKEHKDENIRRLGRLAARFERVGVVAIIAAIAPYREIRDEIRKLASTFVEVHVDCPVEVCHRRDPRGLYDAAYAGKARNVPGVDDPYEAPTIPDVKVFTETESPDQGAEKIMAELRRKGVVRT